MWRILEADACREMLLGEVLGPRALYQMMEKLFGSWGKNSTV
jgi:hypothetical protein